MKCILCETWSLSIICNNCQETLLTPSFYKRELAKDFYVYSFYRVEELEDLLNSKYYFFGDRILNILAKLSFSKFTKAFTFNKEILAIPIDDHTRHEFSHTAILAKALKSNIISPLYNNLKANNLVKYAGKDLNFRERNKRDFKTLVKNETIILVDDIVTTGTTLLEAHTICKKNKNEILFALCLADAKS